MLDALISLFTDAPFITLQAITDTTVIKQRLVMPRRLLGS